MLDIDIDTNIDIYLGFKHWHHFWLIQLEFSNIFSMLPTLQ